MQPAQHDLSPAEINALRQSERAVYRVCIAGDLVADWREYLGAVDVSKVADADYGAVTLMTCEVLDQAQLMGMLGIMRSWGTTLVWLECIAVPGSPPQVQSASDTRQ